MRTVAERTATFTGACAHLHEDQEQKGGYPDTYRTTGCAGQQAQATDDLRDAYRVRDTRLGASATLNLPRWREALRKKLRECSGPDSGKSGDRLPEGAGVLSICQEGDSAKSVFLR